MKDGLFLERIELPHLIQKQAIVMYFTTGCSREEVTDLCIRICAIELEPDSPGWPPCLGLYNSVVATLAYMRHNRTQAEIGESFGVFQPTVSRAISVMTPLI